MSLEVRAEAEAEVAAEAESDRVGFSFHDGLARCSSLPSCRQDYDKDVVSAAAESISQLASLLGPAGVWAVCPKLAGVALQLLQAEHPCQGDNERLDDDDDDHDGALWEAVGVTPSPPNPPHLLSAGGTLLKPLHSRSLVREEYLILQR